MIRNQSHLPTKLTDKDHAKQFPNVFGNKRKSTINSHFETAKNMRMSEQFAQQRQITMTEVVAGKIVASVERIKVSGISLKLLRHYPWV
jgi:hypothetical protein